MSYSEKYVYILYWNEQSSRLSYVRLTIRLPSGLFACLIVVCMSIYLFVCPSVFPLVCMNVKTHHL